MQYNEAYIFLDSNRRYENPIIRQIIESLIASEKRGLPVIINRNPTIMYGGILQMFCVGISSAYSLLVPLEILRGLAADFDGDSEKCPAIAKAIVATMVNCWEAKLERAC